MPSTFTPAFPYKYKCEGNHNASFLATEGDSNLNWLVITAYQIQVETLFTSFADIWISLLIKTLYFLLKFDEGTPFESKVILCIQRISSMDDIFQDMFFAECAI